MARNYYKASAPGSLMLFGEHAVLHGQKALCAALNLRVTVKLTPRRDQLVVLKSNLGGIQSWPLNKFNKNLTNKFPAWRFVIHAILIFYQKLKCGFTLEITSNFSSKLGFGSSAAVTVATLAALTRWLFKKTLPPRQLLRLAVETIQNAQGFGSGADCAASIYGGVIAYKMALLKVKKIAASLPLTVVYSGVKVPTQKAIAKVARLAKREPKLVTKLYRAIGNCALQAEKALVKKDYVAFGQLMNRQQELQAALGLSAKKLDQIIAALRASRGIFGAKISGAGLGDSVIGLGQPSTKLNLTKIKGAQRLVAKIAPQGLRYL